jgi:hypothetical protein
MTALTQFICCFALQKNSHSYKQKALAEFWNRNVGMAIKLF